MRTDLIDRRPLSEAEQLLIAAATNEPWTPQLRASLVLAVGKRGIAVGRWDDPGDLVGALELAASEVQDD